MAIEKHEAEAEVKSQVVNSPLELMSATALAAMVDELTKAIVEKAKPGMFVELTSTERVHSYKPNIGIEGLAGTVARYAEDDPRLGDGNDPKEMLDLIALVEELQKAKQAVSATERSIEDTILVVRAELFRRTSSIYRLAQAVSRPGPTHDAIAKAFDDFATRGRKGRNGEATPVPADDIVVPTNTGDS